MGKTNKRFSADAEDEKRQEKILEQLQSKGRIPVPPPGHYHDDDEKHQSRKERKQERNRLKNLTKELNNG